MIRILVALALCGAARSEAQEVRRPFSEEDARGGVAIYLRECACCHGERGRGDGAAAPFLPAPPRDFTTGTYKLRSTPSGTAPTSADVMRTIERGIPGSAMPGFGFLPSGERRTLAAYVLSLGDLLEQPEPAPLKAPPAPERTPGTVARGRQVYLEQGCASCHGDQGLGDGPSAATLVDDTGRKILVRNLAEDPCRGGEEREDLYLRILTGMDGSPMPGYAESIAADPDRWSVVDYVLSLREGRSAPPLPRDAVKAGRVVAQKHGCRGCHVLDDGKGGDVGPDLRVAGKKLDPAWVRTFLADPRKPGKIYPWRIHRMPDLQIAPAEVEVLAAYLQAMGKRKKIDPPPDVAAFPAARVEEGKNLFVLSCAQCHQLGKVVETPAATQQGPDLANVHGRVDYAWTQAWVVNPKKIDPNTRMTVQGLTPQQIESVRMFIYKVSAEEKARGGAGTSGAR